MRVNWVRVRCVRADFPCVLVIVVVCYMGEINNPDVGFSLKSIMLLRPVEDAPSVSTRNKPSEWGTGDCMVVQLNSSLYKVRVGTVGIASEDVDMMGLEDVIRHTVVELEKSERFNAEDFGVKDVDKDKVARRFLFSEDDEEDARVMLDPTVKHDGPLWIKGEVDKEFKLPSKEVAGRSLIAVFCATSEDANKWQEYPVRKFLTGGCDVQFGSCGEAVMRKSGYDNLGGHSPVVVPAAQDACMPKWISEVSTLCLAKSDERWIEGQARAHNKTDDTILFLGDEGKMLWVKQQFVKVEVHNKGERVEVLVKGDYVPAVIMEIEYDRPSYVVKTDEQSGVPSAVIRGVEHEDIRIFEFKQGDYVECQVGVKGGPDEWFAGTMWTTNLNKVNTRNQAQITMLEGPTRKRQWHNVDYIRRYNGDRQRNSSTLTSAKKQKTTNEIRQSTNAVIAAINMKALSPSAQKVHADATLTVVKNLKQNELVKIVMKQVRRSAAQNRRCSGVGGGGIVLLCSLHAHVIVANALLSRLLFFGSWKNQ